MMATAENNRIVRRGWLRNKASSIRPPRFKKQQEVQAALATMMQEDPSNPVEQQHRMVTLIRDYQAAGGVNASLLLSSLAKKSASRSGSQRALPSDTAQVVAPDAILSSSSSSSSAQEVEQLQRQVALLHEKCGRLQAQNILVAVQQLDWLARSSSHFAA